MEITQIFHFTLSSQPVFTCSKSIMKTKRLCKICPKLTRKVPVQMCGTNVCTFSVILTSLHSLNLSFPLPFGVISTAMLSFHFDSHSDSPHFSHFQPVPRIPGRFQTTTFSSYSSFSHPYSTHSPHSIPQFLIFTDSLLSWSSLKNYFRKIVALVQKRTNTPVCYYYITFSNRLLFISSMTSSVLSPEV